MRSAKDRYIELLAAGLFPSQIDDQLLCDMMDEELLALELAAELKAEQLEKGGVVE